MRHDIGTAVAQPTSAQRRRMTRQKSRAQQPTPALLPLRVHGSAHMVGAARHAMRHRALPPAISHTDVAKGIALYVNRRNSGRQSSHHALLARKRLRARWRRHSNILPVGVAQRKIGLAQGTLPSAIPDGNTATTSHTRHPPLCDPPHIPILLLKALPEVMQQRQIISDNRRYKI